MGEGSLAEGWLAVTAARFVRAFLLGAGLGAAGAVSIYSAAKVSHPVSLLYHQRRELAALDARLKELREKERAAKIRLAYFSSEQGRAQRLHEAGRLLPGERFVCLLDVDERSQAAVSKPQDRPTVRIRAAAEALGRRVKQAVMPGQGDVEPGPG